MKLYVVRNKEGKFFRSIGYGGTGANWVEGLDTAKFKGKYELLRTFVEAKNPLAELLKININELNRIREDLIDVRDGS